MNHNVDSIHVSIIITSYNYGHCIHKAIESVLVQTFSNWELIIVDNASTDNSVEVITRYAQKDNRINVLLHEKNLGLQASVQHALQEAKYNYVAFLEADDILFENSLEKRVNIIKQYPETALVFSGLELFGDELLIENLNHYSNLKTQKKILSKYSFPAVIGSDLFEMNLIPTFSVVLVDKRKLLECNFDSPIKPNLDWFLWSQITKYKVYYLDEVLTKWRIHSDSYLHRAKKPNWRDKLLFELHLIRCFFAASRDFFKYFKAVVIVMKAFILRTYLKQRILSYLRSSTSRLRLYFDLLKAKETNLKILISRKKPCFPAGTEIVQKTFNTTFPIRRAAVFALYSANGKIENYVLSYLRKLKKHADAIVIFANCPIFPAETEKLDELAVYCEFRQHDEYDFGSYKRGFNYLKQNGLLKGAEEVIFCNCSCFVAGDFDNVFSKIEADKDPNSFWGMIDSHEFQYHLQSYFYLFKRNVWNHHSFLNFINDIKKQPHKFAVIQNYELKLTRHLHNFGFKPNCILKSKNNPFGVSNLTLYPAYCLKQGVPLIKKSSLTSLNYNGQGIIYSLDAMKEKFQESYEEVKHFSFFLNNEQELKDISFSIILPTFNRKHCIGKAIDSVLESHHQNFELIISDDGSTDGTLEFILERYATQIQKGKIKFIRSENNCGASAARNKALRCAKKPWITYLDSNNTLREYSLGLYAEQILVFDTFKVFYGKLFKRASKEILGAPFNYNTLLTHNYIDLNMLVHHKSVYDELGGFDENARCLEDWELNLRYMKKFCPYFIQAVVADYDDSNAADRISKTCDYKAGCEYLKQHGIIALD